MNLFPSLFPSQAVTSLFNFLHGHCQAEDLVASLVLMFGGRVEVVCGAGMCHVLLDRMGAFCVTDQCHHFRWLWLELRALSPSSAGDNRTRGFSEAVYIHITTDSDICSDEFGVLALYLGEKSFLKIQDVVDILCEGREENCFAFWAQQLESTKWH